MRKRVRRVVDADGEVRVGLTVGEAFLSVVAGLLGARGQLSRKPRRRRVGGGEGLPWSRGSLVRREWVSVCSLNGESI